MTSTLDVAALLVTIVGILAGACVATVAPWRTGLVVALDFWTAAGLLRLAEPEKWQAIAGAAGIILVRQVVSYGLRRAPTS